MQETLSGQMIIGATLGDCRHVAGLLNFLRLAEGEGYETRYVGAGLSPEQLLKEACRSQADVVAVSYRLTAQAAKPLLRTLKAQVAETGMPDIAFVLGGTSPVCQVAQEVGLFDALFDDQCSVDDVLQYLRGEEKSKQEAIPPQSLLQRVEKSFPRPLLRHHYGRPTMGETVAGIEEIARAQVLDIISLGPDQNAQRAFFRSEEQRPDADGAGGVPVRSEEDLARLYRASRRGNYPLMRCYSGTADVFRMAEVLLEGINNAWCAVPLYWYSVLDGRGPRSLKDSISESQKLMQWHAERGVPVEVNESHHWSLRDGSDTIAVATAYLAAYNARAAGVTDYIAQFMFNTPRGTSFVRDLGKMLAKLQFIESLADEDFRIWRQVRSGLFSFPPETEMARGQLASSTMLQMATDPHIVHVVGYSEADHAATADEVIRSCRLTHQVVDNALRGIPDMTADDQVRRHRDHLIGEATILLRAIEQLAAGQDPFTDVHVLVQAVKRGYLDAPHLVGNPVAKGTIQTAIIDGACVAIDPQSGRPLSESDRLSSLKSD